MEHTLNTVFPGIMDISVCILFFFIGYTSNSVAETGDKLIIIGDIVNLRAEPSTSANSLIKLTKNREVTEIRRQQDWVEIETYRKDVKTGWVHQSLLSKAIVKQNTSSPTHFDRFMQRFNDHNEVIKKQNGIIYFSEVKNKGQWQIEIVAAQAWLNAQQEERGTAMNIIFKIWNNIVPVGSSMSVRVFDKQGEQHMLMLR
jgi:SH3-like domain-containing protein